MSCKQLTSKSCLGPHLRTPGTTGFPAVVTTCFIMGTLLTSLLTIGVTCCTVGKVFEGGEMFQHARGEGRVATHQLVWRVWQHGLGRVPQQHRDLGGKHTVRVTGCTWCFSGALWEIFHQAVSLGLCTSLERDVLFGNGSPRNQLMVWKRLLKRLVWLETSIPLTSEEMKTIDAYVKNLSMDTQFQNILKMSAEDEVSPRPHYELESINNKLEAMKMEVQNLKEKLLQEEQIYHKTTNTSPKCGEAEIDDLKAMQERLLEIVSTKEEIKSTEENLISATNVFMELFEKQIRPCLPEQIFEDKPDVEEFDKLISSAHKQMNVLRKATQDMEELCLAKEEFVNLEEELLKMKL